MINETDTTTGAPATAGIPARADAKPARIKGAKPKGAKPKAAKAKARPAEAKTPAPAPSSKGPPPLTPEVLGHGPGGALSEEDRAFLAEQEAIIEEGFKSFLMVGRALLEIREYGGGRLWRAQYGSFESYCNIRWGFDRQYGYRLMDAARVIDELKVSPRGDSLPEPTCEAQVRPVAMLADPADRVRAWQMTVEEHGPDPLGREVGATVRRMIRDGAKTRSDRPVRSTAEGGREKNRKSDGAGGDAADPPGRDRVEPETGTQAPDQPAPDAEAEFMRSLKRLEILMAVLRDPDAPMSDECLKQAQAFGIRYRGFLEDVAECSRTKERDARQRKLPPDAAPRGGAKKGAKR